MISRFRLSIRDLSDSLTACDGRGSASNPACFQIQSRLSKIV